MQELPFKNANAALDYIEKFFADIKIAPKVSFYGVVRMVDASQEPETYMVEISAKENKLFAKGKKRIMVAAIKHPEQSSKIEDGDFVVWGCDNASGKIASGFILHKAEPTLDSTTMTFKLIN